MPRHCSATGCRSRDNKDARLAGVTFHRLPKKGNPRRATWIANARRKGPGGKGLWEPQSDYIYFCSKHFTPDSFELSGVSGYRRLKDDAVPMLVEILPGQKGKSSRERGKTRNERRPLSSMSRADKESSGSSETRVKVSPLQEIPDEDAASIKIGKEVHPNETPPVLPLPEPAPDQPTERPSTPPSPSRFMRRLPPPPGFYLAKEHSYAQLCPLEWRKRYEKATDNLEKALRLLRAARRRENRLRLTLLRLQESRVKQTSPLAQERRSESQESQGRSSRSRQSEKPGRSGQDRGSEGMEVNEMEGTCEDIELLTDESWRKKDAAKLRDGVEDEEGCCFYCGRGREEDDAKETKARAGSRRSAALHGKRGRGKNAPDLLKETPEPKSQSNLSVQNSSLLYTRPEMLLHMHTLPAPAQSTFSFQEVTPSPPLQHFHLLQPDLSLLHPDTANTDTGLTQSEDAGGGMCQVFLVPVSSEPKEKSSIKTEESLQQAISQQEHVPSENVRLSPSGLRANQNDPQTNRATLVGGDLTQKLKEHLEGFQLQLSNEFMN